MRAIEASRFWILNAYLSSNCYDLWARFRRCVFCGMNRPGRNVWSECLVVSSLRCYYCNKLGHIRARCMKRKRNMRAFSDSGNSILSSPTVNK